MIVSMRTTPVSATLNAEHVSEAKARVGARQFSRYLDEALALRLQHDRLTDLEDELAAEHGPIPDQIQRGIDSQEWPR
jgi:hypothetical protein